MKRSLFSMCCVGLVAAGAMIIAPTTSARADQGANAAKKALDAGKDAKHSMPGGMDPQMAAAMQRMAEYGALNENHGYLKQFEGEWDCTMKWWMNEGGPVVENKFTSNAKVSFDGHFLVEKVQGNMIMAEGMPPQPFSGMSIIGYDNHKKQFTSTWIDNMTSAPMTETGSASEGGKIFTFEGDNYCCMNDKTCHTKTVATIVDANTRKMEMWGPDLNGKVYKACEFTYTRKK